MSDYDPTPEHIASVSQSLKDKIAARKAEKLQQREDRARRAKDARNRRYRRQKARELDKEIARDQQVAAAVRREMRRDEKAQMELARREMARRHLLPYIVRMQPSYKAGWFHKDLCLQLEQFLKDVMAGLEPRLMLFVPPRHGKSITTSQHFPAWAFGKHPELEFIQTSYAESLQLDFSKKIQTAMNSAEYQTLFPGIIIPKRFQAASDWKIAKVLESGEERLTGGGLLAAGVGGPLSGRGAHIATVDDPLKNREEADSEVIREAIKSWYSSTFTTRLAPGGGILIIQTRWHDDDLAGWQLRQMAEALKEEADSGHWPEDAERWKVVSYPAIAIEDEKYRKKGEPLHPERYSLKSLLKKKRNMIPRDWSALYQQNPVSEEGEYFTKEMWRTYKRGDLPKIDTLNVFAAGDLAISTKETADYTVFLVVGLDVNDNLWVLDARRGRWDADQITDQMLDIQETWKPLRFGVERDKVAIAIGPLLNQKIRKQKSYGLVVEDLQIGGRDKRARARPWQGRMKQGQVLWPEGADWVQDAQNEHMRFDAGVHDDFVDAGAWVGQMLANETYVPPRKPKEKPWRERLKGYVKATKKASGQMAARVIEVLQYALGYVMVRYTDRLPWCNTGIKQP